jgi:RimJ/RimL family protein N-acetyltransferase
MNSFSVMYSQCIPLLHTERLVLHGPRLGDFDDSAAMWGDPETTRYIGGRQLSREEAWARLHRYVGHWMLLGHGFWVVRESRSGQFIGEVGFADFKRDLGDPGLNWFTNAIEVGWVLSRAAHGRGFATEAVLAAIAWGKIHFGDRRMVCMINPDNCASIRVASKCRFRERAQAIYKERPILLFERRETDA